MDAAESHVGYQQRTPARQPGVAELSVYGALLRDRQFELPDDSLLGYLHHDALGGLAILHEHHVRTPDRLRRVYLRALRCLIAPHGRALTVHLGHAILMGHEDVPV